MSERSAKPASQQSNPGQQSNPSQQSNHWPELDAATREARLAARLRANLLRRKQQVRARQAEGAAGETGPGTEAETGQETGQETGAGAPPAAASP